MELITLTEIIHTFAISLGVGASTIALTSFFYAISDGNIDTKERNILGLIYAVLRIAMLVILVTFLIIVYLGLTKVGSSSLTDLILIKTALIFILFGNALLMTIKIMPSRFGPAIQASSWYSLGYISALVSVGFSNFAFASFIVQFVLFVVAVTIMLNLGMSYLKKRKVA